MYHPCRAPRPLTAGLEIGVVVFSWALTGFVCVAMCVGDRRMCDLPEKQAEVYPNPGRNATVQLSQPASTDHHELAATTACP